MIRFDIHDAAGRDRLLESLGAALQPLTADRPPVFGTMNAQQMVEHLLWTFEISTGAATVTCPMPEEWQKRARSFLNDDRLTPRGFENPHLKEGLPRLRFADLEGAVAALESEARRFLDLHRADPQVRRVHPVFGPCTLDEWSRAHFKHCVHHLLQFGLIEMEMAATKPPN